MVEWYFSTEADLRAKALAAEDVCSPQSAGPRALRGETKAPPKLASHGRR